MKDIYEIIRHKEIELERVQKEIDALHLAARLLDDTKEMPRAAAPAPATRETPGYAAPTPRPQPAPTPTVTPSAWASAKQFP
jgi:hypothetical protein